MDDEYRGREGDVLDWVELFWARLDEYLGDSRGGHQADIPDQFLKIGVFITNDRFIPILK